MSYLLEALSLPVDQNILQRIESDHSGRLLHIKQLTSSIHIETLNSIKGFFKPYKNSISNLADHV